MKWNKSKKKLRGWQSYRLFLAEKKEFFCSDSDWFGFTHMCFSRFIWFDVTVYVFIVHHALQYSLDRKVHWQLYGHCTTVLYWGVEFYFSYFLFPNFLYFYSYFCFLLIFFPLLTLSLLLPLYFLLLLSLLVTLLSFWLLSPSLLLFWIVCAHVRTYISSSLRMFSLIVVHFTVKEYSAVR